MVNVKDVIIMLSSRKKNDQKVRVCNKFFIFALGVTNRCIISKRTGSNFQDKNDKYEIQNHISENIIPIPKIESPYRRAHSEKQ